MRSITPARRSLANGLFLLAALSAVSAQAQTGNPAQSAARDLRGIWMAQNTADASLERAHVIVDPPDGRVPYLPGAAAKQKENFRTRGAADPESRCFQPGVPRATYLHSPLQIFQNDRAVYIAYQDAHSYRILYLDGSPHNEGLGFAMGDSRAHWEGNTLVADVTSFSNTTWLDAAGDYHSDALHVTERYTRSSPETLLYEATIEDPRIFARPWTIRMPLQLQKNIRLVEDECEEGENGIRHHARPAK